MNLLKKRSTPLICLVILVIASCTKTARVTPISNLPNVYVAATVAQGLDSAGAAIYFKNNTPVVLPANNTKYAAANAIVANGSDIYIAGSIYNQAAYWKNGVAVILPANGATMAAAMAICLQGTDVYVAGWESNPDLHNFTQAVYWKNGVEASLPLNNLQDGSASGIAVNGSDIYITGCIGDSNGYWRNGTVTPLPHCILATGISVAGSDVYISGSISSGTLANYPVAAYWKNGVQVTLGTGGASSGADAITLQGNDVYAAGYESTDNVQIYAKYWKNGVGISPVSNTYYSRIYAIAVQGNDVYSAGRAVVDPGSYQAVFWKNDTLVAKLNQPVSQANGIVVVKP
jgi:uncharacterized membrane protein